MKDFSAAAFSAIESSHFWMPGFSRMMDQWTRDFPPTKQTAGSVCRRFERLVKYNNSYGQIIATSHDLTPNGGLVREILYFREI